MDNNELGKLIVKRQSLSLLPLEALQALCETQEEFDKCFALREEIIYILFTLSALWVHEESTGNESGWKLDNAVKSAVSEVKSKFFNLISELTAKSSEMVEFMNDEMRTHRSMKNRTLN